SVVAGPNVAVTGGHAFISQPPTSAPVLTEKLASDSGASASDKITANPALTGTADPNAVVHFTVDGAAVAATATADATGAWSYTPAGLAAGSHTVVASETDAAGNSGSASLTFTLSTSSPPPPPSSTAPLVTAALASDTGASATDKITSNAALSGTA